MSTHNIPFSIYKRKPAKIIPNLQILDISKGLKNEFETAVVDTPSVVKPLKVYCTCESVAVGSKNIKLGEYLILL